MRPHNISVCGGSVMRIVFDRADKVAIFVETSDLHPHTLSLPILTVRILIGKPEDQLDDVANVQTLTRLFRRRGNVIATR